MSGDLVAFLRARLDEDAQVARAATDDHRRAVGAYLAHRSGIEQLPEERPEVWHGGTNEDEDGDYHAGVWAADGLVRFARLDEAHGSTAEHIARWDPARVLAEVEAKRSIVDRYETAGREADSDDLDDEWEAIASTLELTLCGIAQVYRDHPDYRQEWAP